jgi:methylated-DNA-[protein]-cysteine S-methyltransferase
MNIEPMGTGRTGIRHTGIRHADIRYAVIDTTIGELTISAAVDNSGKDAITGLYFPQHWHLPDDDTLGRQTTLDDDPLLAAAARQLDEYLDGERTTFDFPMATSGDPFQERVWALLRQLPFGETTTYGELAERLGDKSLARVVGQAVGRNPLSIFVGCHRVLGKDGKLTGYAGGLERKRVLLALEETADAKAERLF